MSPWPPFPSVSQRLADSETCAWMPCPPFSMQSITAHKVEVGEMRTGFHLASFCLAATTSLGVLAPAKTAPPITSGQVCATYPPQLVAQKLDKQTQPVASPGYSTKLTSVDFAVYCSYRFSAASMLNIVFYGPAHPVAELSGKKVLALGPSGRLLVSPPRTFVFVLSHGYQINIGGQTAAFSQTSLVTLALYITRHIP
jgi:hypothetical protein